jgi:hypothetical protein
MANMYTSLTAEYDSFVQPHVFPTRYTALLSRTAAGALQTVALTARLTFSKLPRTSHILYSLAYANCTTTNPFLGPLDAIFEATILLRDHTFRITGLANISLGKLQNLDDKIEGHHKAILLRLQPNIIVSPHQYDHAAIYIQALGPARLIEHAPRCSCFT